MGLESATYLASLTTTNPPTSDNVAQGDDHIRLLKTVLKNTFPGADHAIYLDTAEASVASAATTNIGAAASNNVSITGTTTITAFDTVAAGIMRQGRFAGILTLTHNGTSLILPGAANITTAANDRFWALSLGSGNWIVLLFQRASGAPLATDVSLDTSPTLGGHLAGGGFDITGLGTLSMTEQAAANADVAGDGQLWVKTATPNELWFTDDAGTDFEIATIADVEIATINADTSTALDLALTDAGQIVTMDNASANVLTIKPDATVAFVVGTVIEVVQIGAGVTTITADTGVILNGVSTGSGAISARYAGVSLLKIDTDTWVMSGSHGTVA